MLPGVGRIGQASQPHWRRGASDVLTPQVIAMFSGGEKGYIHDYTNPATMLTPAGGGARPAVLGDLIAQINDLSPNGINALIGGASPGNYPIFYNRNGVKFAHFDGNASRLLAQACDMTGTTKITVVLGLRHAGDNFSANIFDFSNGSASGAIGINHNGPSALQYVFSMTGIDFGYRATASQAADRRVLSCVFDFLGATILTRVSPRAGGVVPTLLTGNTGGSGTGGGNFSTGIGGAQATSSGFAKMDLYRMMIIGRQLTPAEILVAEAWASAPVANPSVKSVVFGDSTVTGYFGALPIPYWIDRVDANIVAVFGETIAQQNARANQISSWAGYAAVFVQIGLNDLNPATATATTITALQSFITNINAKKAVGTKVIISQMNPCKGSMSAKYGAPNVAAAYQKWLDMNDAIAGNGATPITGVDARVISPAALNDGSGNLAAQYDEGGGIHPNNAGKQLEGAAWDAALASVGL